MAPFPKDEALTLELMKDPKTVGNISDAGAHLQMLCGRMTGKLAGHFNLNDRGVIAVGKRADIAVFNMDEIQRREMVKAHDVPDGRGGKTWRFTRAAMPTRLTLVNGEATFENGAFTGAMPGKFLSPANEDAALAVAAE
jgi:N-acyl-D-amino-acid deacylase